MPPADHQMRIPTCSWYCISKASSGIVLARDGSCRLPPLPWKQFRIGVLRREALRLPERIEGETLYSDAQQICHRV